MDPLSFFLLLSMTIILGYLGYVGFERTRVPEFVWLLLLGLLIGPVFRLVDPTTFMAVMPLLSMSAILFIAFDAGLNLNIAQTIRRIPHALVLSLTNLLLCITVLVGFGYFTPLSILLVLLLAIILGVNSTAVTLSLLKHLRRLREEVKGLLTLETIVIDPVILSMSLFLIKLMVIPQPLHIAAQHILALYLIGGASGLALGLVWIFVFERLRRKPFAYMLSLAAILSLYILVEQVGGDGILAILVFGLALGNSTYLLRKLGHGKLFDIGTMVRKFHNEILFLLRSLLFLSIGVIVNIDYISAFIGMMIFILLALVRMLTIRLIPLGLSNKEAGLASTMLPRGFLAITLSSLALTYGIPQAGLLLSISFVVVLATIFYAVVGIRIFYRV